VARSVSAWNGPVDPDHLATVHAPSSRIVDHRFLGTWSARDAEEILGHFRLQLDLAPDFAARYEDVFAVAADALVAHMTFFGTARDSGGPFENRLCALLTFGADGRITESNVFEAEQEAEALARFDEITGTHVPVPRPRGLPESAETRSSECSSCSPSSKSAIVSSSSSTK
jgi:ketosteroid isomerase-like protein